MIANFIITLAGIAFMQLGDYLMRDKQSDNSPEKGNWEFFWKDNKQKLALSVGISISLAIAFHVAYIVPEQREHIELQGFKFDKIAVVYFVIGAIPETILQIFKSYTGFLQPKNVLGYDRKN